MDLIEKTKTKNYIYNGKIINVRCDEVLLSNGKETNREIVEHNGGSSVLCVKEGKILFVEQFRYAYGKTVIEIPAGKLEKGEDSRVTAVRELEEEAGIKAKKIEKIFEIYPTPGYTNEIIHVYYVEEFEEGTNHLDEGEFLNVKWIDKDEVKKMLESGEIKDAKTIIALQYYFLNISK